MWFTHSEYSVSHSLGGLASIFHFKMFGIFSLALKLDHLGIYLAKPLTVSRNTQNFCGSVIRAVMQPFTVACVIANLALS